MDNLSGMRQTDARAEIERSACDGIVTRAALRHFCQLSEWTSRPVLSRAGLAFCATITALLLLFPAATLADTGIGAGQVSRAAGIAVDDSSGDVYVLDNGANRVEEFDSTGKFLMTFGWGVSTGAQELQVCTTSCFPGVKGAGAGEFAFAAGIGIDNDPSSPSYHDIYVYEEGEARLPENPNPIQNLRVQKFSPDGQFLLMFGLGVDHTTHANICTPEELAGGDVCGSGSEGSAGGQFEPILDRTGSQATLTVDSSGTVWVGQVERIEKFNPDGSFDSQIALPGKPMQFLAVDSTGDFYTGYGRGGTGGTVTKFSPGGTELFTVPDNFSVGDAKNVKHEGIALDPSDDLFIIDKVSGEEQSLEDTFGGVLEFNAAGEQIEQWDVTPFESKGAPINGVSRNFIGMVYNNSSHEIYEIKVSGGLIVPFPTPGPLLLEGAESAIPIESTTATLNAVVNPEGEPTTFRFEYVNGDAYDKSGYSGGEVETSSTSASIGEDFKEDSVSADISGLKPETLYHYRIVAKNKDGEVTGSDETFRTKSAASFEILPISEPDETTASIALLVNPHGLHTTIHFGYGSNSPTEHSALEQVVAASTEYVPVSVSLTGLTPNTRYHIRIVAENAAGTLESPEETFTTAGEACPNEEFRTGPSAYLPDCRAYEQVTPVEKNGQGPSNTLATRPDGEAVAFSSTGALPGSSSALYSNYVSRRTPGGWQAESLNPPTLSRSTESVDDYTYIVDLSADLSRGLMQTSYPVDLEAQGAAEKGETTQEYLREPDGSFTWISRPSTLPDTSPYNSTFQGASADLSRAFFRTQKSLTADTRGSTAENLYEWANGAIETVNLAPGTDTLLPGGAEISNVGTFLLKPYLGSPSNPTAVSTDGSTVFFISPIEGGAQEFYVRHNGETQEISVSRRTGTSGQPESSGVQFLVASTDGSKVMFVSGEPLTNEAPSSGAGIYQYEIQSKELTYLAPVGSVGQVSLLGATSDLSSVYFVELLSNPLHDEIDSIRDGVAATVTDNIGYESVGFNYDFDTDPQGDVSPDGRYLVFTAASNVTPYSTDGHREVYEYDAGTSALVCVSCRPDGSSPTGDASLFPGQFPGDVAQGIFPQSVNNDGNVFFNSTESLVPRDSNKAEDVYEYEGGALHLISSGTSTGLSEFFGASEDGRDVFFFTYQSLVSQDTDNGVLDVYDARVGGGFPSSVSSTQCKGEECRAPAGGSPLFAGVGSGLLSGSGGNLVEATVKVGKKTTKSLTKAQELEKALRACGAKRNKRERAGCKAQARKKYEARSNKAPKASKPRKKAKGNGVRSSVGRSNSRGRSN